MKLVVFVCVFSHSCGVTGFMCTYVCARVRVCGMFDKPVLCTYVCVNTRTCYHIPSGLSGIFISRLVW